MAIRRGLATIVVFNLTDGQMEGAVGLTSSSSNAREVSFVRQFVAALVEAGLDAADVMALSGYDAQSELLQDVSDRYFRSKLSARKINSSQGDEHPMVVLSLVRRGPIGFMANPQRQNVGCSRAQEGFFVVCHKASFDKTSPWEEWFADVHIYIG